MRTHTQLKMLLARLLIAPTALVALAQVTGAEQPMKPAVVAMPPDASVSVQGKHLPRPRAKGAEAFPASRVQAKRHSSRAITTASSVSFLPVVIYDSGGLYATSLAVADLNGDSKPDVVVVNFGSGTVDVLLGNGDGALRPAVSYVSGSYWAVSVAVADLNGDSRPDLVVTTCADSTCNNFGLGVLLGNGDGTFQPAVVYGSGGYLDLSVAVADVNGDGKPDLAVANYCVSSSNCANGSAGVLLGNGDGTFKAALAYDSGGLYASRVAVSDVNGDGKADLVVANYCVSGSSSDCANGTGGMVANGSVGVLLGNGDGTFQPAMSYDSGGKTAWSITVADVDRDNRPDLVVTNACGTASNCTGSDGLVGVLMGNGDGTFQAAVSYDSGGLYAQGVAVADVDADGKLDLLVTNLQACFNGNACPDGSVDVLLGNGDGTFQAALSYDSGALNATSVAVDDVNGDGRPDVVVANYYGGNAFFNGSVGVLLNNTTEGKSTTSTSLISSLNPSIYGQPVTFTATVTTSGSVAPAGTVNFKSGSQGIGTGTLNASGVATFTTSLLKPGFYRITALYNGDASNLHSISAVLYQAVKQK